MNLPVRFALTANSLPTRWPHLSVRLCRRGTARMPAPAGHEGPSRGVEDGRARGGPGGGWVVAVVALGDNDGVAAVGGTVDVEVEGAMDRAVVDEGGGGARLVVCSGTGRHEQAESQPLQH